MEGKGGDGVMLVENTRVARRLRQEERAVGRAASVSSCRQQAQRVTARRAAGCRSTPPAQLEQPRWWAVEDA